MLKKDDPDKQLVYYQAGIGTYTTPDIATPFASAISKVTRTFHILAQILIYVLMVFSLWTWP